MVKKVGLIIQAHMGSTRLPGKVLKTVNGISVLGYVILRLQRVRNSNAIIVATSTLEIDDVIVKECEKYGVLVYRGDNDDVLSRYYRAAERYKITDIARICSDNMFIDPEIVENEIAVFLENDYDLVTSGSTIPLGLGAEIFSFKCLEESFLKSTTSYEHEHVAPYIYEHGKVHYCEIAENLGKYRFTLDTEEDWKLVNAISSKLDPKECVLKDIVKIMKENPEFYDINKHVKQKP